ncbi:MAG: pentapeptide repeat-containing protein [Pseudomonadales bacterium]|nr:pentapeptide repeat-containing protein [Pseudomonadales bacterium]
MNTFVQEIKAGADLRGMDLRGSTLGDRDLTGTDLRGSNLMGSSLRYADLRGVALEGANISGVSLKAAIGDMKYIKSAQLDRWSIVYTSEVLQIGSQNHPIESWWSLSDREIGRLGDGAVEWWKKYKPLIKQIIETSPAQPTGWKAA